MHLFIVPNASYKANLPAYSFNLIVSLTRGRWATVLVSFDLKILHIKLVKIFCQTHKTYISHDLEIH